MQKSLETSGPSHESLYQRSSERSPPNDSLSTPGDLPQGQTLRPPPTQAESETADKVQQLYFSKTFRLTCAPFWESLFFLKRALGDVLKKLFRSSPASFCPSGVWNERGKAHALWTLSLTFTWACSLLYRTARETGDGLGCPFGPHTQEAILQCVRQTYSFCFLFLYQRRLYCPSQGQETLSRKCFAFYLYHLTEPPFIVRTLLTNPTGLSAGPGEEGTTLSLSPQALGWYVCVACYLVWGILVLCLFLVHICAGVCVLRGSNGFLRESWGSLICMRYNTARLFFLPLIISLFAWVGTLLPSFPSILPPFPVGGIPRIAFSSAITHDCQEMTFSRQQQNLWIQINTGAYQTASRAQTSFRLRRKISINEESEFKIQLMRELLTYADVWPGREIILYELG